MDSEADEIVRQIADIILSNKQKIESGLYMGKTGIAIFLMYLWRILGNNYYYDSASELVEAEFDYLTYQSHRIIWEPTKVDLSVSEGCAGIMLGINFLTNKEWIKCPWEEVAIALDPAIFGAMLSNLHPSQLNEFKALSFAQYALIRHTRFAREYIDRFMREWGQGSTIGDLKEEISRHSMSAAQTLYRISDYFISSSLSPCKWFTSYNGLYKLNYGVMGGLAGIGLSLIRKEDGYDDDWQECFFV